MQKKSQALFQGNRAMTEFQSAQDPDLVQPMISVSWASFAAAFRIVFEQSEDIDYDLVEDNQSHPRSHKVFLCVDSLVKCIAISSKYTLETERDAFLSTLAKLTGLTASQVQVQGQKGNQRVDMKHKNIIALHAMLTTARNFGENYDQRSWAHVIRIASQLDRLYYLRMPSKSNEHTKGHSPSGKYVQPSDWPTQSSTISRL
jgi:brefeldin A-inhibited guanine nucleotide-exchange protein